MATVAEAGAFVAPGARRRRKLPVEVSIILVLIGMALIFEILGWALRGQSFLGNPQRLLIIILQVSTIGLLAVGVTQVIITGGIDLSSGSVVALSAMVAASFAQESGYARAVFPSLTGLPAILPILIGLAVGAAVGVINGSLITLGRLPPFIATLGTMVTARGLARYYTHGQPISMLENSFNVIGAGANPVLIFISVALLFHIALRYTRYGKFTYAIGGNIQAARVSGIDVNRHLILVYTVAGLLSGLGGIITAARATSGQAGMGMSYELDAIAAAVIGGTSLSGGIGRITGTVVGTLILGVMTSGFTFLGVDAYIQDIVKGIIIIAAVMADQYRRKGRRTA
ncbi:MAG: ABC transporter permease [Acetobacteraceae bacterium]|nr:ABC transporter permease [Acetobacteraceae bacterium]MBV8577406.1 ABC transporter permease [Acetobacteraceae bacterium]